MYKVGDLVLITASYDASCYYMPPALVIKKYEGIPSVFKNNEEMSREWMLEDGIGSGVIYDILHDGSIETGVLGEWLRPWVPNEEIQEEQA